MKTRLLLSALVLTTGLSVGAIAQTEDPHHPAGSPPPSQTAPPAPPPAAPPPAQPPSAPPAPQIPMDMGQMMQRMPPQCRTAMQNMPPNCLSMMQQMMQGRMGMMPGGMQAQPANQSAATKAYLEAAERMHAPMLAGLQATDPDVAFVRGMIAHHQGAIDMAKVVLQYGKDDQAKKWANEVIREQQREIAEMEEWLKNNTR